MALFSTVAPHFLSQPWPTLFRDLLRFFFDFFFFACSFLLSAAFFHVLLQLNSILINLHYRLLTLQIEMRFSFLKFLQEKMSLLSSPVRLMLRRPLPSPRVCTDGRSLARSYGDVITKFTRLDCYQIF